MATGARLGEIASWLRDAHNVVALTGAGISTDSGIPDFRGPQGIWTKDPKAEKLSTLHAYMTDPEVRARAWQLRLDHPAWSARPNAGHLALAELESKGKLDTLITQNIDGLHQQGGTSQEALIEIHGTIREVVCMMCAANGPMEQALARVRAGERDPRCRSCDGILKSATVSFGQPLAATDMDRARRAALACDVFLAVGTSLTVFPVAYLPRIASSRGAKIVIVNEQPTAFDDRADAVVHDSITTVLPGIVELV